MAPAAAQDVVQVGGEPLAQPAVERAQRLVEQQQPRLDGEGPGEGDPLALASREGRRQPVGVPREADELEQLGDPLRAVGPAAVAGECRSRSG